MLCYTCLEGEYFALKPLFEYKEEKEWEYIKSFWNKQEYKSFTDSVSFQLKNALAWEKINYKQYFFPRLPLEENSWF